MEGREGEEEEDEDEEEDSEKRIEEAPELTTNSFPGSGRDGEERERKVGGGGGDAARVITMEGKSDLVVKESLEVMRVSLAP